MYRKHTRILPHRVWFLLALLLLLAGCGKGETPTATSQAEPAAPPVIPTAAPLETLVGFDLLTVPGIAIHCDGAENAQLVCGNADGVQSIQTTVPADGYARWSVRFGQPTHPLSGHEVLTLRRRIDGNLAPNIYFVEQNGKRTYVPLSRFSLAKDWQEIHIPLHEFVDSDGNSPDFSAVREIQIVCEWADMQGEFLLDSLRFDRVWEERVTPARVAPEIHAPDGFVIEAVTGTSHNPTQLETPTEDSLLISEQAGRIWWYWDDNGDGLYDRRRLYDTGYSEVVGLLYDPLDGAVWIGGRGQLWRTLDSDDDGVADVKELRLDGLPWGRHQNNGLAWNPDVDPFSGEPAYSWIYFGLGSLGDLDGDGNWNAAVLRFPRSSKNQDDLEIVSRGNRNAYDVVWAPIPVDGKIHWSLFASENGPDFNDAPDEVNHIRWGLHYGFPEQFGMTTDGPASRAYTDPVVALPGHTSADGLAFVTDPTWPDAYRTLYVALFGEIFGGKRAGHTVQRIELSPVDETNGLTFQGNVSTFIDGLERPLALTTDSQGRLLVADYVTGIVYRVRYTGQ